MKLAITTAAATAMLMVIYALILKALGMPTQGTIFYYVIFAAGVAVNTFKHLQLEQSLQKLVGLTLMPPLAAFGYACWVIFNTRVLIGGPIPSLVLSLEQATTPEQSAAVQRYIDSPELFAANIGVVMTILGVVVVVAVALGHFSWRFANRKTDAALT